jgi:hypothetical protein
VIESWNTQLYSYVYKFSCRQCCVILKNTIFKIKRTLYAASGSVPPPPAQGKILGAHLTSHMLVDGYWRFERIWALCIRSRRRYYDTQPDGSRRIRIWLRTGTSGGVFVTFQSRKGGGGDILSSQATVTFSKTVLHNVGSFRAETATP